MPSTHLAAYVIHCKDRPKVAALPPGVPEFVAQPVEGAPWICYPWDAPDIHHHTRLAAAGSGQTALATGNMTL